MHNIEMLVVLTLTINLIVTHLNFFWAVCKLRTAQRHLSGLVHFNVKCDTSPHCAPYYKVSDLNYISTLKKCQTGSIHARLTNHQ